MTAIPSPTPSPEAGPTVTITYTLQPTPSPDASSPLPSRGPQLIPVIPSPSSSSPSSPTTWSVPPIYTNFDTFSVTHYAGGQSNMEIVTATASPAASPRSISRRSPEGSAPVSAADTDQSLERSILRVLYPEGSINPASRPQGGAQFYANPLDITQARSVTLEYDVYFPADFEFVLGGKLPGLFGGKESCSGGDAALDCFSTRLMWREEGAGELYLVRLRYRASRAPHLRTCFRSTPRRISRRRKYALCRPSRCASRPTVSQSRGARSTGHAVAGRTSHKQSC